MRLKAARVVLRETPAKERGKNSVELSLKTLVRLRQFEAAKAPCNKGPATMEASR